MATAQTVIDSARYDLNDFGEQKWDDTQLLNLLNRMVNILDSVLISLDSDFTKTSAEVTLSSGGNTASAPTRCDTIQRIWIDTTRLIKEPLDIVMHRFQVNDSGSSTGKPTYWAHNGANIYFNIEADDNYTLDVYFHQYSATLALGSDMPHGDMFNEMLREAIVNIAHKAKDNKVVQVDQQYFNLFKQIAIRRIISRNKRQEAYIRNF